MNTRIACDMNWFLHKLSSYNYFEIDKYCIKMNLENLWMQGN